MRTRHGQTEFLFQLSALIVVIILVHASYAWIIRPQAAASIAREAEIKKENPEAEVDRSWTIVVKDLEQEACFILFFWAMAMMAFKGVRASQDAKLLSEDFTEIKEGQRFLPEDARELSRKVQALPAGKGRALLPRALLAALHRFESTRNVQDVSSTVESYCVAEGERLESELSMIRYIAWAIPSIGFVGTVRGIGMALSVADGAVEGEIGPVTASLGVAFNSTFVALLISLMLMFVVHQLQLLQERYVLDTQDYCENRLVRHLHVSREAGA